MQILYNLLTSLAYAVLWCSQFFSTKMRAFIKGRKHSLARLAQFTPTEDTYVWFHCASLGEFEQGVPIMEAIKERWPEYKLVITFFSPSGYEIKKETALAEAVLYLPWDTPGNAKKFVQSIQPKWAFFIKYEFWPNYLKELHTHQIPTFLISGLFRPNQLFFKRYGSFYRNSLHYFTHFFLQNTSSESLLHQLGFLNTTVSGDTRFDRVARQIEVDNTVAHIDAFVANQLCLVCGSTWQEDEDVLLPMLMDPPPQLRIILAPHKVDSTNINRIKTRLKGKASLYSEWIQKDHRTDAHILIIDNIGLLSKLYSYADLAYVGGAMGSTGLHNILEPATFGVPIIIGKHYDKFPEAKRLRQLAGLYSIANAEDCTTLINRFISDAQFRSKTGMITGHFVNSNTGATRTIMNYLETH